MSSMESVVAISLGAALGANLRWVLSNGLNAVLPHLPLGTLTANLIGAFLIGIGVALFAAMPALSAFWRLFFITGFLGALTTFSTFAAEVFSELQAGRWSWGVTGIIVHVAGSLSMVGFGMAVFFALRHCSAAAETSGGALRGRGRGLERTQWVQRGLSCRSGSAV